MRFEMKAVCGEVACKQFFSSTTLKSKYLSISPRKNKRDSLRQFVGSCFERKEISVCCFYFCFFNCFRFCCWWEGVTLSYAWVHKLPQTIIEILYLLEQEKRLKTQLLSIINASNFLLLFFFKKKFHNSTNHNEKASIEISSASILYQIVLLSCLKNNAS